MIPYFHLHPLRCAAILSVASVALLTGCGSEEASGIKPVSRLPDLATPAPETVASAADRAAEATAARIQEQGASDRPTTATAPGASSTGGTTAPLTSTSQVQGIPAPPKTTVHQGGNVLAVAGIAYTLPSDWKQVPPSSGLRAAQYEIPGPGGPAEMAVFYFGPGQGGNVDQNVRRWVGQFTPDGTTSGPLSGEVGTLESDSLKVTLVRTRGTYNPGTMGTGDPTPKPGYGLFGLVVEGGPEGNIFVKVTGPAATLDKQKDALEEFARSTRKSSFK